MAYHTNKNEASSTRQFTNSASAASSSATTSFKRPNGLNGNGSSSLSGTKGQSFPTTRSRKSLATQAGKVSRPIPSTTTLFDSNGLDISKKGFMGSLGSRSRSSPPTTVSSDLKQGQKSENHLSNPSSDKMKQYFSRPNRSTSLTPKLINDKRRNEVLTSTPSHYVEVKAPSEIKGSESSFTKLRKPAFPRSETRGSFQAAREPNHSKAAHTSAISSSSATALPSSTSTTIIPAYKSASLSNVTLSSRDKSCGRTGDLSNYGRRQQSVDSLTEVVSANKLESNYESDKMKAAQSELSLLEQKKLQWAKEKEELNGLWSPWGRHSESGTTANNKQQSQASPSPSTTAMQMQASYPPPANVVSSAYVANLGLGPQTFSQQSHSECYLPPINSTIAQQPRQKAKVWNNAEFQTEDYRYENDPPHSHQGDPNDCHHQNNHTIPNNPNRGVVHPRKASLPNYTYEGGGGGSGDGYHNNGYNQHQQMVLQQHNKLNNGGDPSWGPASLEEDRFTSGYYSSENNNYSGEDLGGGGGEGGGSITARKETILKPTSRERSYQEEVTVQKAIAVKKTDKNGNPPSKMVMHKIYTQNGEVFAEREGMMNQEVVVNSMTVSTGGGGSTGRNYVQIPPQPNENSRSPAGNTLPRNHAMRSSLTIGVDASNVDAYYENDRRQKEEWLNELEKQRDEQRLRKMMEKEERRPRWGDRGIGVGHFWEPSDTENSHLPAPPLTSRSNKGGGSLTRSESHAGGESYAHHYNQQQQYHHPPGQQSHTPPAWLERSLTRMQSSKSQPSLHDPEYIHDLEYSNQVNEANSNNNREHHNNGGGDYHDNQHQNLGSSRSLNQSAIDLSKVAGYASPTGDMDRSFLRGQNVPIDPDTLTEREKKRVANQEHLDALKKQIEERQQQQKEEKERRLQEEREQEMRMAKQREVELQRLEMEKRGRMPVNGDMPNCVEDSESTPADPSGSPQDASNNGKSSKATGRTERERATSNPIRDPTEEKDIEIVQRQSVMVGKGVPPDEDDKTTESSSASMNRRLSRHDQSVMTDTSDPMYERTLTPSIQRSRSLSTCRSIREFGTQTELSDGSSSTSSGTNSSSEGDKNCNKTRSHNSLLDKKAKEGKKELERKQSEERPRWGSNPVKKQYIKQSEKDPNYFSRMKRRQERLKRMEEERSARADTGTESEDVNIPFHRIRQRRISEVSPSPRKVKGITPLKAITHFLGGKTDRHAGNSTASSTATQQKRDQSTSPRKGRWTGLTNGASSNEDSPRQSLLPEIHPIKNAKSESHLNQHQQTSDILDKNFGSVAGINGMGTSEESSGFSTPFMPRRDHLGSGSTESGGSGTTGSGSGVQSPDLVYHSHTYHATKATREERKYTKMTSGRDTHSISNNVSGRSVKKEFKPPQKPGFIHQQEFDEMPIKTSKAPQSFMEEMANIQEEEKKEESRKLVTKVSTATIKRQQRNRSLSPTRKVKGASSPVKADSNSKRVKDDNKSKSSETLDRTPRPGHSETNLPHSVTSHSRPLSPPVPALLKKMQMGLTPDETGRISSLPTEFPDILAPLPAIPMRLLSPINPPSSRLSSATSAASSTSAGKIDIDIAVTPRRSPEINRLLEAAEEKIKQRQLTAIITGGHGGNDSGKSRRSFEADIGNISINLEPVMLYPRDHSHAYHEDRDGMDKYEFDIPAMNSARVSIRSHPLSTPRTTQTARGAGGGGGGDVARHEAFITSILNRKEVKEQLSARESELSEKGIIEFSIRLPSNSSNSDFLEEYRDPLLTERRRHTAQWLYGGQSPAAPQKQAILTNLATLKKGLSLQEQDWKVNHSDAE